MDCKCPYFSSQEGTIQACPAPPQENCKVARSPAFRRGYERSTPNSTDLLRPTSRCDGGTFPKPRSFAPTVQRLPGQEKGWPVGPETNVGDLSVYQGCALRSMNSLAFGPNASRHARRQDPPRRSVASTRRGEQTAILAGRLPMFRRCFPVLAAMVGMPTGSGRGRSLFFPPQPPSVFIVMYYYGYCGTAWHVICGEYGRRRHDRRSSVLVSIRSESGTMYSWSA